MSASMEEEKARTSPVAVFMAFGTKGDVYPVAAIAASFAADQRQYEVAFVTHSAHENLQVHLGAKGVSYFPVSSPPALSYDQGNDLEGSIKVSFCQQKKEITRKHRQECISAIEKIFGEGPVRDGDFMVINFFALEGWSLAELFHVRCVVAAPYIVPYSAPSSFERKFRNEFPLLYKYLREAPHGKIGWEDIIHWMWPLFTVDWGIWRSIDLKLSFWPFTDPVTGLPSWHDRPSSPLLLYGFSQEIVECPGYWPSAVRVCGFWLLPIDWQFSCPRCAGISSLFFSRELNTPNELCSIHSEFKLFLDSSAEQPIFISLSSMGSMGYLKNPKAFLRVLDDVLRVSSHSFILFSAGYGPLDEAIEMFAETPSSAMRIGGILSLLFSGRLLCFSGDIPYRWLFPRCSAIFHHGGSGSTTAALHAGIPQVICPFILDQFYWAERMYWLGVSAQPLRNFLPDNEDNRAIQKAADSLVRAINYALSSDVKLRAAELAYRISKEDGVSAALQIIKKEILCIDAPD